MKMIFVTLLFVALATGQTSLSGGTGTIPPCHGCHYWKITPDKDVERHITQSVGERYHQHCTNSGDGDLEDGFMRCTDMFTNKRTGQPCRVSQYNPNRFECITVRP